MPGNHGSCSYKVPGAVLGNKIMGGVRIKPWGGIRKRNHGSCSYKTPGAVLEKGIVEDGRKAHG